MLGVGYLLPMNQRENESTIVEVDAKSLRLTHLSKVMFPDDGFTKAELLLYYQTIAPILLPHLACIDSPRYILRLALGRRVKTRLMST